MSVRQELLEASRRDGSYHGNLGELMAAGAARINRLESAVILARKQFAEYEEHHLAKKPADLEKAATNAEFPSMLGDVLVD